LSHVEEAHQHHARRLRRLERRHGLSRADAEDCLQNAYLRMLTTSSEPANVHAWVNAIDSSAALDLRRRQGRERAARAALVIAQIGAEAGVLPATGAYKAVEYDEPVTNRAEPTLSSRMRYAPPGEPLHPYPAAAEDEREALACEAHAQLARLAREAQLTDTELGAVIARFGVKAEPWADVARRLGVRRQRVAKLVDNLFHRLVSAHGAGGDVANTIQRASYNLKGR
jgi:DNA-directed RNA polymerase specialized sigma24 family protein